VAHIYNLRKQRSYREKRMVFTKTKPTPVSIGERRQPDPNGRPGYLRVDTVHQGDLDGVKGVYHINAVDEVTQWQVVGATSHISEAWLQPVLEAILAQFPFRILGSRGGMSAPLRLRRGSGAVNHSCRALRRNKEVPPRSSKPAPT
jgi:hypothetical protein